MESVDELIDVLEAAVHAEASSWGVGVSCVASQKNVFVRHFVCELGLQFPSSDVDYLQVVLDVGPVLLVYCCLNQLIRSVYLEQIHERLIIWDLQYELASF